MKNNKSKFVDQIVKLAEEHPEQFSYDCHTGWIHNPSCEGIRVERKYKCVPWNGPKISLRSSARLWKAFQNWCENRPLDIPIKKGEDDD